VLQDRIAGNSLEEHPKLCGHISESEHDVFCRGGDSEEKKGREVETTVSILGRDRSGHELREVFANGVQEEIDRPEEEQDWTNLGGGGGERERVMRENSSTHREEINDERGENSETEKDSVEEHRHLKIREIPNVGQDLWGPR
jgi:hypothetical protein